MKIRKTLLSICSHSHLLTFTLTALVSNASAQTVTWNGGNYTWAQPDSDSFDATYNSGDNVVFGNTGITDGTNTQITISGTLTPGDVTFNQTGARTGGATGTPATTRFNYLFLSTNTTYVINSSGNLTLNGGNTLFRANVNGNSTHTFAGALIYNGGVMLGLSSGNPAQKIQVSVGSLATPTAGNSILFNAMTGANANAGGAAWTATDNRLVVTGSKPAVTNGMVSPGIQFYQGASGGGHFMTFSGDNLVPVTSYNNFSGDWSGANSTDIVNLTAATTLTGSGVLNIHALRAEGNFIQNLNNRTIALGSGGLILASNGNIQNGTLDFGSNPGFIGAYNPTAQGNILAKVSGSGGLTFLGSAQGVILANNSNNFTGGLFINGGTVVLGNSTGTNGATAANGNDVVVNDLGALAVNVVSGNATIGGLSGDGDVAPQFNLGATTNRTINISPSSGTHTFTGIIRNGAGGSVLNVIKSGAGTQVFGSGITANYTGTTTVNAGTLLVNGNMTAATGAVTVATGATLGGNGIIGGATTINGTLAPGNSPGTLTISNNLVFQPSSVLNWDINISDTTVGSDINDLVTGVTNLTLDGTINFTLIGGPQINTTGTWRLFDYTGTLTDNTLDIGTLSLASGFSASIDTSTAGQINLVVVPEPTTWALLAASLTAMVIFRRRQRIS